MFHRDACLNSDVNKTYFFKIQVIQVHAIKGLALSYLGMGLAFTASETSPLFSNFVYLFRKRNFEVLNACTGRKNGLGGNEFLGSWCKDKSKVLGIVGGSRSSVCLQQKSQSRALFVLWRHNTCKVPAWFIINNTWTMSCLILRGTFKKYSFFLRCVLSMIPKSDD